jgi:hypothetical protein
VSWKAQRGAVSAGWLAAVAPTVLVIAGSPDIWRRRLWIGFLALDGHGWVSHEAAAALHGLDRSTPDAVEFTVPRRCRRRCCTATVHTTGSVGPVDVLTVAGLRCASATRTILDLARARVPIVRLEAAIDSPSGSACPRRSSWSDASTNCAELAAGGPNARPPPHR